MDDFAQLPTLIGSIVATAAGVIAAWRLPSSWEPHLDVLPRAGKVAGMLLVAVTSVLVYARATTFNLRASLWSEAVLLCVAALLGIAGLYAATMLTQHEAHGAKVWGGLWLRARHRGLDVARLLHSHKRDQIWSRGSQVAAGIVRLTSYLLVVVGGSLALVTAVFILRPLPEPTDPLRRRPIELGSGAWMDSHEVTQREYQRFIGSRCERPDADATLCARGYYNPAAGHSGQQEAGFALKQAACDGSEHFDGLPARCVDWHQAQAFCNNEQGRLPTPQEWQEAAGDGLYPWGDTPEPSLVVVNGCGDACVAFEQLQLHRERQPFKQVEWTPGPLAPGSLPPTGHGFYDLAGNVAEWTSAQGGAESRIEGTALTMGGSWDVDVARQREFESAHEGKTRPVTVRDPNLGFRCAYDERP